MIHPLLTQFFELVLIEVSSLELRFPELDHTQSLVIDNNSADKINGRGFCESNEPFCLEILPEIVDCIT